MLERARDGLCCVVASLGDEPDGVFLLERQPRGKCSEPLSGPPKCVASLWLGRVRAHVS
jgi:hypothetical protein